MTVRKALDELVSEGILYKEKGRGTFVAPRPKYAEFKAGVGFTEEALRKGMNPSTKDSTLQICEADDELALQFKVPVGTKLLRVTRVRCANDIPIIFLDEYYLDSLCPDLDENIIDNSIFGYLSERGVNFAFADQKLSAILCPYDIAMKLGINEGHPLIKISQVTYMKNGVAFNFGTEYYRTDTYSIVQSVYNKE